MTPPAPATPAPDRAAFWRGRRVLLTGHTGFKGAWLALWLLRLGADVTGFALAAPPTALYAKARLDDHVASLLGDVRDPDAVTRAVRAADPQVLLHLAAQPLVRRSYAEPVATYATNVMGTVHLLDAARAAAPRLEAAVVVTSDKCYDNRDPAHAPAGGYREDAPLGGGDPYSSSKGAAELVTAAYRSSFFSAPGTARVATARAGNVIGGGDHAEDRLVPDLVRAIAAGRPVALRHPDAIRPWQHVLDCLDGYLTLAERLAADQSHRLAGAYNFGPPPEDARTVAWIADRLCAAWGDGASWRADPGPHPAEAHTLRLDSTRAHQELGWRPRWDLPQALDRIVAWHRADAAGADAREFTLGQLAAFAA